MALTPTQRRRRARIAALALWSKPELDRLAHTAPGREAALRKKMELVDPDERLEQGERERRGKQLIRLDLERGRFEASKRKRAGRGK